MKKLKSTRTVTYRRQGIPAVIIEGKWLTTKYRLNIGDQVDIDYQPKEIHFRKNVALSTKNQKRRKDREDFRRMNQEITHDKIENFSERSIEVNEG